MITDFIATIAAGGLAGLVVFALRHMGRRWLGIALASWLMPAAVGAAMLGYTIFAEYRWYPQMQAALNDDIAVVMEVESRDWWRPWTYLVPVTTRFMAIDQGMAAEVQDGFGDIVRSELVLVTRWQPVRAVPVAFDCANGSRADLLNGARIDDGVLTGGRWTTVGAEDVALALACSARAPASDTGAAQPDTQEAGHG